MLRSKILTAAAGANKEYEVSSLGDFSNTAYTAGTYYPNCSTTGVTSSDFVVGACSTDSWTNTTVPEFGIRSGSTNVQNFSPSYLNEGASSSFSMRSGCLEAVATGASNTVGARFNVVGNINAIVMAGARCANSSYIASDRSYVSSGISLSIPTVPCQAGDIAFLTVESCSLSSTSNLALSGSWTLIESIQLIPSNFTGVAARIYYSLLDGTSTPTGTITRANYGAIASSVYVARMN